MKVYFKPEGGFGYFPGLNKPLELNSEVMPEEEAGRLKKLLHEASFFSLPNGESAPPSGADQKKYTIRVEDKDQQHWIQVQDTGTTPQLQNLIAYLNSKQKETRQ